MIFIPLMPSLFLGKPVVTHGENLNTRFNDEQPGVVVTGVSSSISSNSNGQVHAQTSVLKPDGSVITKEHHSG